MDVTQLHDYLGGEGFQLENGLIDGGAERGQSLILLMQICFQQGAGLPTHLDGLSQTPGAALGQAVDFEIVASHKSRRMVHANDSGLGVADGIILISGIRIRIRKIIILLESIANQAATATSGMTTPHSPVIHPGQKVVAAQGAHTNLSHQS